MYEFSVTDLTSSVNASKRTFACVNEEVVYRCKAARNRNDHTKFYTEWMWNGSQVATFNSEQQIGQNDTNKTPPGLPFLHATLVSTTNTTCVSLLIVIPSLIPAYVSYTDLNVMIKCETFGASDTSIPHNQMIEHNIISSEFCM